MITEHASVVLTEDIAASGLQAGDVGVVAHMGDGVCRLRTELPPGVGRAGVVGCRPLVEQRAIGTVCPDRSDQTRVLLGQVLVWASVSAYFGGTMNLATAKTTVIELYGMVR